MPSKLEQIALKKKREAEEAREAEIKELAIVIASETISRIKNLTADEKKPLEATISELAKGLAEAVALSNEKLGGELSVSFAKLVDNFKLAIPEKFDNSTNEKLFAKIADDILKFDNAIKSLELNPTINLKGITATELKAEVDRLIEKLPKDAKDSVKIEYEKAGATNYINVRLTDGINFYKALGGGGGGGGRATPYENNQGMPQFVTLEADSSIPVTVKADESGSSAYKLLLDDTTTTNVTYVGKAAIGSATSASVWQIQKIDETSGMVITWGGTGAFDQEWDERAVTVVYA